MGAPVVGLVSIISFYYFEECCFLARIFRLTAVPGTDRRLVVAARPSRRAGCILDRGQRVGRGLAPAGRGADGGGARTDGRASAGQRGGALARGDAGVHETVAIATQHIQTCRVDGGIAGEERAKGREKAHSTHLHKSCF